MNAIEELNKACGMAEESAMGLLKSHVSQYTRADGTVVQEHEDSRKSAQESIKEAEHKTLVGKGYAGHMEASAAHKKAAQALEEHKKAHSGHGFDNINKDISNHEKMADRHSKLAKFEQDMQHDFKHRKLRDELDRANSLHDKRRTLDSKQNLNEHIRRYNKYREEKRREAGID